MAAASEQTPEQDPRLSKDGALFLDYVNAYFLSLIDDPNSPKTTLSTRTSLPDDKLGDTLRALESTQSYLLNLPILLSGISVSGDGAENASRKVRSVVHSVITSLYTALVEDCERLLGVAYETYGSRCGWAAQVYELLVTKIFFPLIPLGRRGAMQDVLSRHLDEEPQNVYTRMREYAYPLGDPQEEESATTEEPATVRPSPPPSRDWEVLIYMTALATLAYAGSTARQAASVYDSELLGDQRLISGHVFRVLAAAVGGPTPEEELDYTWDDDSTMTESLSRTLLRLQAAKFALPVCMLSTVTNSILEKEKTRA